MPSYQEQKTVLIVTRDQAFRNSLAELLQIAGICPLIADTDDAAIEIYRTRYHEIEAVFLELRIPASGGLTTLARLRSIDATAKVILISGYAPTDIPCLTLDEHLSFLRKPFGIDRLLQLFEELIRQPSS